MDSTVPFRTTDEYIDTHPTEVQELLLQVRQAIREGAPEAEEVISYQMPTYRLRGNLLHFAAFKNHIGIYPGPDAIAAFQEELSPYKSSKGTIQFPKDKPIPYDLIRRITEHRVKANLEKEALKKKK